MQIVFDGLDALHAGGNVVTNDLHFSGSLHNHEGLRRTGMDVRVVRADDDFEITLERMVDAMDERTALVAVSLVSNVNGRIEPMAELSSLAHDRGALVYAGIIQAAGAIPIDVHALDIDFAAASSYEWLFGIHGAGFVYVKDELQGTALRLGFIEASGGPDALQLHSTRLTRRLRDSIDTDRYRVITPEPERSPILSLLPPTVDGLIDRLIAAGIVIGVGGDMDRLVRISPAIYNDEADVDRLAEVLAA
jgi:selenocysteine lyase/cysteine desulfurase